MGRTAGAFQQAWASIRSQILTGIAVIVPLLVTVWVIRFVFNFLDGWLRPIERHYLGRVIPGTGLLATVLLLYLIGLVVTRLGGRTLVRWTERLIMRLPLIGDVYGSSQQIMQAVGGARGRGFRRVVLCPFPQAGSRSVGFVTQEFPSEKGNQISVFVPTVPNPTSGFLLILPASEVTETGLGVEEAVKMIVSAGVVTPAHFRPQAIEPIRLDPREGAGDPVPPGER
jgi:uncharacterized membrane protein